MTLESSSYTTKLAGFSKVLVLRNLGNNALRDGALVVNMFY